jgi:hypothetical protein
MFYDNIHLGETNNPDDDSGIFNDMQLYYSNFAMSKNSGHPIIYVRHTLLFPINFLHDPDWTAVQTQDQVSQQTATTPVHTIPRPTSVATDLEASPKVPIPSTTAQAIAATTTTSRFNTTVTDLVDTLAPQRPPTAVTDDEEAPAPVLSFPPDPKVYC